MNKQDYEAIIKRLQQENDNLKTFIYSIRNHIDTNLQPFRDDIADFKDERNKGVLAVLTFFASKYNKYFRFSKIEMLPEYKCNIIKFKVIKGDKDVEDESKNN